MNESGAPERVAKTRQIKTQMRVVLVARRALATQSWRVLAARAGVSDSFTGSHQRRFIFQTVVPRMVANVTHATSGTPVAAAGLSIGRAAAT